jgi:peptidoglycan/xylan/chitin deacetylase (PgdA/CDA1 family)
MVKARDLKIPILMYHQVLPPATGELGVCHTNPSYTVTSERFLEQMSYLAANGYRTLTLDDVVQSGADLRKAVVITFDDGWVDNYTAALPVLSEFGFTATVFVVTGFVGQPAYMNWDQLNEMNGAGLSIESHTVSHRPLGELCDDMVLDELVESKIAIERYLGKAVKNVSMPQGVYSPKVVEIARYAGYSAICTSDPGYNHCYDVLPVLKRINIDGRYEVSSFSRIVAMAPFALLPEIIAKKGKNLLKRLIGYDAYRRIYSFRYTTNRRHADGKG